MGLMHSYGSPGVPQTARNYNALIEVFKFIWDIETPIYHNHIKIEVCEPFHLSEPSVRRRVVRERVCNTRTNERSRKKTIWRVVPHVVMGAAAKRGDPSGCMPWRPMSELCVVSLRWSSRLVVKLDLCLCVLVPCILWLAPTLCDFAQ